MNRLAAKLAAFSTAARNNAVKVNVHAVPNEASRSRSTDSLVLYACLVAGGAGIGAIAMDEHDRRIKAEESKDRAVRGQIIDETDPGFIRDLQKKRLNYVQVSFGGKPYLTLDEASRIQLTKEAANAHQLESVGLSWKDLYGVIHAETNWIARDGMGKNGIVSQGLAQLEPATAKSLGVSDANDPLEALNASAALLKEAAQWSRSKVRAAGIKGGPLFKEKFRDGVSIYYNLSTRARNAWDGMNINGLPVETQHHIKNTRQGARIAVRMERELKDKLKATDWQSTHFQPTHKPTTNAGEMRMNLDGSNVQGPVGASVFEQMQKQLSFMQNVHSLQQVLQSKSEIKLNARPMDLARACLATNPLLGQAITPRQIARVFPNAYMLGEAEGVPVFMARTQEVGAAALMSIGPDGRVTPGIILSEGLVEGMKGPGLITSLNFVIGHELGHLRLGHRYVDDYEQIMRNELEADSYGISYTLQKGTSPEVAAQAAAAVLEAVMRDGSPEMVAMTSYRTKEMDRQVAQLLEASADGFGITDSDELHRRQLFAQR